MNAVLIAAVIVWNHWCLCSVQNDFAKTTCRNIMDIHIENQCQTRKHFCWSSLYHVIKLMLNFVIHKLARHDKTWVHFMWFLISLSIYFFSLFISRLSSAQNVWYNIYETRFDVVICLLRTNTHANILVHWVHITS